MTSTQLRSSRRTRPFVVVVCDIPLLGEAVRSALDFVDVQAFSTPGGDLDGLLRWLRPDALIVDSVAAAEQAATFADERDLPIVRVSVAEPEVRLYQRKEWQLVDSGERVTPAEIRNVVAGALFTRGEG